MTQVETPSRKSDELAQAFNRVTSAYNAGNFREAEQFCQQIVTADRNHFDAFHVLAVVQAAHGKKELALANYDRAVALRPNHADALSNRGNILLALNRIDEALASYDRALAARPNVAHLAGALGKPVWMLLTHVPDWRWLRERTDSPWYSTARLFRQDAAGAWDDVITRVEEALARLDRPN